MNSFPNLRPGYVGRLFQLLLFSLFGLVVAGLLMGVLTHSGVTTKSLRIATVVQDILVFILPAILTAAMVTNRPDRLLETERRPDMRLLLYAVAVMIVSMPVMNAIVMWNESLTLPDSLHDVESWMRMTEENARRSVETLLGGSTVGDLVVSIFLIGILAGLSEEIYFRGTMQRLLASEKLNAHSAIWITAIIFSIFHFQFFGFFPRLILGAFFGYLLYWSGSLWLPVAVHALNNTIVVVTSWYAKINPDSSIAGVDRIGTDSLSLMSFSIVLSAVFLYALSRRSSRLKNKSK
ncbi:MAG: CPBP family intramembrane metalloprotease [Duncaniella sp.]|nr:CPBP family intramembrane metalloprotease [Duncaniella sp.]MDE6466775.1 CPBP family intramembrane metalloprotease [Duncaniella sp.]